ncbi:MAG: 50S ribosomal protein L5 [Verrucomicrobia bacterium]|nr:50S ribosomal protein L5 [Verrucomicrobiota bacterium]
MSELFDNYRTKVVPQLVAGGRYKNPMQVPRMLKIVLNTSVGSAGDKQAVEDAAREMTIVSGQKPIITKAKKSISNFKLRKDQEIGCKVTLRGNRMYEFMERFINSALPRVRDFRGVSNRAFDGHGAYTYGVDDQTIFPEIELDKIKRRLGMDITFVTTARNVEETKELLKHLGMPFAAERKN